MRVFPWEKDVEAAWGAAKAIGCSSGLWLELAEKRGKTHPEEAIPIYEREIAETLRRAGDDACRAAVGHLRKVPSLLARLGRQQDFARLLDRLRTEHRRKRNFLKLLGRAKWN